MTSRVSTRAAGFGILGLAIGYFIWYVPYSGWVKALSSGEFPGVEEPVGGLVLLPAAAIGQLIAMPIFLTAIGWWRYAHRRQVGGRRVILPTRSMLWASFWMSLIIGTTTLNYTFIGASILLMLLLMRGGVLVLSPIVDTLRRKKVHRYSWIALALSLGAVAVALGDVSSYSLGVGGAISVSVYLIGYIGRFTIMSRDAKTGDPEIDRRYFVDEHIAAPVFQLVLCAIPAIIGLGAWGDELRQGFTDFLTSPAALPAMAIGVLYEGLFIFGTWIYLDPREYTWAVPANRCSSIFAGVVSAFGLTWLTGIARPGSAQLVATLFIVAAVLALSWPAITGWLAARGAVRERLLLFVCGGNTCRSPMAAAIAAHELAAVGGWTVASAGVSVRTPGQPVTPEAVAVLGEMGIPAPTAHSSRPLTAQLCRDSDAVYCMTSEQRDAVLALAPEVTDRTYCLDETDVPDPIGQPMRAYRDVATRIRTAVRRRLSERPGDYALSGAEGA